MSLKEIQVLARRQVDAVEVVRLVNLKIVLLVYCFYRLKYSFSWNTLFKLGYHFLDGCSGGSEVVRLVNLKIVLLVYCFYRLKYSFSWNTLFKLGYHFLGRFLKTQNELFF